MTLTALHLFQAVGVELEYMIVRADSLDVAPIADRILGVSADEEPEVVRGDLCWSNELVRHVIELKTNGPAPSLDGLAERFQGGVGEINAALDPLGARLMPTAMHPWMDPLRETELWPYGNREIYQAFDRIFGCQGHGWSNLQSAHLNLPFADDDEFGRLHAAVRLVMPILPALAASSPLLESRTTGILDNRLDAYRVNCRRIPSVTGRVIPEPVFTPDQYRREILEPMYRDIAPLDPDAILQDEWLNARGAIARFERNTIEIRVLDVQECPAADLAVLWATVETVRALTEDRWASSHDQRRWPVADLEPIFLECMRHADQAQIHNPDYPRLFGLNQSPVTANTLWRHIIDKLDSPVPAPLETILAQGPLARRILTALESTDIRTLYTRLCDGLAQGSVFTP